jgi:hypothetical protein
VEVTALSNSRKLAPRPPGDYELAFFAELEAGCPECGSRRVRRWFDRGARVWGGELICRRDCPTWQPGSGVTGHSVAAAAASRTGRLRYFAFGDGSASGGACVTAAARGGR